jgi:hypothetical protein
MPIGPGKYDDLCTHVRRATTGDVVIVIVAGGTRGSGLSMQSTSIANSLAVVPILRRVADDIEADVRTIASKEVN